MGIYDRDYSRDDRQGFHLGGDRMLVTNLVLVNVAIYLVDVIFLGGQLARAMALKLDLFSHPWQLYQLVTYGFAHDPGNLMHVAFNMFGLWFFGRDIELKYGRKEFLSIYLTMIVFAGLVWMITERAAGTDRGLVMGASGGVVGIMLLFVLHFPYRTIYIWAILPVPAWVLAALWLFEDVHGAINRNPEVRVAYAAHFAGAAFALFYYKTGWSLGWLIPRKISMPRWKRGPRLKVHDPDQYEVAMSEEVDRILRKIQQEGQDSLTAKERRALENASRRYQQKHR